jgi:epoxyqueuosine reductase
VAPPSLSPAFASLLKAQAYGLGFDLAGIARLGPADSAAAFDAWIAAGYAGEMGYLARGAEKRRDSRLSVPASRARTDARATAVSAVVVAMNYGGREPDGPVARYARGDDYHDLLQERLEALHRWVEVQVGHAVPGKAYVDTGPLLERDLARRAGLGWFGKNTNLIHPERGSFHFLGALLLGLELEPDAPFEADRCGTCTRCLHACPTDAFVAPRVLDATRCISYLTIEVKDAIPEPLRAGVGDRAYGCDVCQTVCPWNVRFAKELPEDSPFKPREALAGKDARTLAREILAMDVEGYRAAFRGSPMKRAKLPAMKRNAAVVLGNVGTAEDVDVLTRALDDPEPLVREHAAWALARLAGDTPSTARPRDEPS